MFLKYYNIMVEFLQANAILIALLMTIVQYVKLEVQKFTWYSSWMSTVFAFVMGFLLAVPEFGFVSVDIGEYIVHGIGLGLVATGIYKIGEGLMYKTAPMVIAVESRSATKSTVDPGKG